MIARLLVTFGMLFAFLGGPASAAPAPDKWDFWEASDPSSTEVIDHSLWQDVLTEYVKPSDDGINRFAYKDFAKSESKSMALPSYLHQMSTVDPRKYNAQEQQAFWINLYNALTVHVVLKYPKKKSILRMGEKFFAIGPWDDKVFEVAGQELTLNDIEHRILRPIFKDQRVHFAVNCASIGCPNLGTEAFTGENLDAQLTANELAYVNHPRGVTFDKKGRLVLSQLFQWYSDDFAPNKEGIVSYFADRHETLGDKMRAYDGKIKYKYDWGLNAAK